MSFDTNALKFQVLFLGLLLVFAVGYCKNPRKLDWKSESDRVKGTYEKELRAHDYHNLGREIYAQDFVRISPGSVIMGDFEALENFYKEHFNIHRYTEGPPHVVSTCGNTSLVWREHSFLDDKGVMKKGTYVALYVSQNGEIKNKLFHSTV